MDSHFFSSISARFLDGNEGVDDLPFSLDGLLAGTGGGDSHNGIFDLCSEDGVVRP